MRKRFIAVVCEAAVPRDLSSTVEKRLNAAHIKRPFVSTARDFDVFRRNAENGMDVVVSARPDRDGRRKETDYFFPVRSRPRRFVEGHASVDGNPFEFQEGLTFSISM